MKICKLILISLISLSFLTVSQSKETKDNKVEKTMDTQTNMMEKFEFLLGNWNLEYKIPKSPFSEEDSGSGTGTIKRALDDKYVFVDYEATLASASEQKGKAHGVFAWDEKAKNYKYWWFESSGSFNEATCKFVNDEILFMNWPDSLLIQSFTKKGPDKMVLRMEYPVAQNKFESIMEVIFTRK
ncbi:MAG: DUF1579 family protein [Phycisphaerales bacterium]|jgi:hypothetical protein